MIENKIFAPDSNRTGIDKKENGYDGQLERYYNTIYSGYSGVDKDGNLIRAEYKCETIYVFYLTMFQEKQPSSDSIGNVPNVKVIYYGIEITMWLQLCIAALANDNLLKGILKQYLNLIERMTHNDIQVQERKELKVEIAQNWVSVKYLMDNFKHIKWHTVHEFWCELKSELEKNSYKNVEFFPTDFDKVTTEITHKNRDVNHGVLFNIDEKRAYVSGYGKLTWGIVEPKKWIDFNEPKLVNISFSDFSTDNTYCLINHGSMKSAVNSILSEISEEIRCNFKNLK